MRSRKNLAIVSWMAGISGICAAQTSQQPPEPIDITPIDGGVYYLLNQLSGLNADLNNNSTLAGDHIVQQQASFTSLSQRWAFTQVAGGVWQIGNTGNGLCLASAGSARLCMPRNWGAREGAAAARRSYSASCPVVQNPCASTAVQQWSLMATSNGYYMIVNKSTGLLIGLSQGATSAGATLAESQLLGGATQSQQWLLRPAFFRGIDNALLEKQEAARAAAGLPWWIDAGQQEDVLQIFKNHGINMVRLRPSSVPPYANVSQAGCSGNACYSETDAQDLDLAKRAKNLGMSIELTLLFDGGSSSSVPPVWANDTQLSALQSDLYNYVKAEILSYRQAGTIPDLVSIGNEVDTGFLGSIGSPTGQNFGGFAALQTTAMQAIRDAAADTSIGPTIPAPLTCIHITPAWDLTQFFTLVKDFNIPYDAICQSYYPIYHGPLTDAQAAVSNPGGKPVEHDVLVNAANNIGKPIFIIETGEHYENGFDSNDPWYAPPSPALQSQFLQDLSGVITGLPNNLGMGIEYWDPAGVDIHNAAGQLINGDNLPNAIYIWNGLTLFSDTDSSLLPGIDAIGGKAQ
jgi:arabinogalactan endo-1,4-beta-galactosidase